MPIYSHNDISGYFRYSFAQFYWVINLGLKKDMVQSMTGFARVEAQGGWGQLTVECRSVNHRYLDLSFKLPESLRSLESALREKGAQALVRGKIECRMYFQKADVVDPKLTLNQPLIDALIDASEQINQKIPHSKPISIGKILSWPQVVMSNDIDNEEIIQPVMEAFQQAVDRLNEARLKEGARTKSTLLLTLEEINKSVDSAKTKAEILSDSYKQTLMARFDSLAVDIDPARVEAELTLLLQRMDVTEELDRLQGHCQEVAQILAKGGRVGRRLDFLMQELNREANTLSSKSQDLGLTNIAVDLKVLIEQMREQIQNIA